MVFARSNHLQISFGIKEDSDFSHKKCLLSIPLSSFLLDLTAHLIYLNSVVTLGLGNRLGLGETRVYVDAGLSGMWVKAELRRVDRDGHHKALKLQGESSKRWSWGELEWWGGGTKGGKEVDRTACWEQRGCKGCRCTEAGGWHISRVAGQANWWIGLQGSPANGARRMVRLAVWFCKKRRKTHKRMRKKTRVLGWVVELASKETRKFSYWWQEWIRVWLHVEVEKKQ